MGFTGSSHINYQSKFIYIYKYIRDDELMIQVIMQVVPVFVLEIFFIKKIKFNVT